MTTLLEEAWEFREETLYRQLFGNAGPGIFPLSGDTFSEVFKTGCDPRWLTIGVFECPPHGSRATWTYVSSGLSNPWEDESPPDDPDALSWLGVEYIFNTTQQAAWAIQLVQYVVAYDLVLAHGMIPGREAICVGDRIPVQIRDADNRLSDLRMVMIAEPEFIRVEHRLPSGQFHFHQLVGITEQEAAFCRANDMKSLTDKLRAAGHLEVTDPWRGSVVAPDAA